MKQNINLYRNNNSKISIIIPVYNAEKYLRACLNSLVGQTYKNIEILCINDGSKDNSLRILEEYTKKDCRVKVFSQENAGPAKARNVGLEQATGEFIMFCDADDEYCSDMCKKMLDSIIKKNVDLVMCDTLAVDKNNKSNWLPYYFSFKNQQNIDLQETKSRINVYLWNKIFKKDLIDKYNIDFPVGHKSDDNLFVFKYLSIIDTVYFLNKKLIKHYERENSIMDLYRSSNIKINDLEDKVFIIQDFYSFLKKNNILNENLEFFKYILFNEIFFMWINVPIIWQEKILIQIQEVLKTIDIESLNDNVIENKTLLFIKKGQFDIAIKNLNYLLKKKNVNRRFYCVQDELKPNFLQNNIPIVFNCDNNFVKYLSVVIQSIIENSSIKNNYDIIILNEDITVEQQESLKYVVKNYNNFSIRFYNMENYIKEYNVLSWFTINHINHSAYYRIFIPKIFSNFEKLIYLDADLILKTDIANLFNCDMENKAIAAVKDFGICNITKKDALFLFFDNLYNYLKTTLKIKNINNYFNSGVLVIDVKKLIEKNYFDKFIEIAKINNQYFHDQNILNSVLQDDVKFLTNEWNIQMNGALEFVLEFFDKKKVNIYHFCSGYKPWNTFGKKTIENIFWWEYARKSPFYEDIIFQNDKKNDDNLNNLKILLNKTKIKRSYYKSKILSFLPLGKKREHYVEKRNKLKNDINFIRDIYKS